MSENIENVIKDLISLHKVIQELHEQLSKYAWISVNDYLPKHGQEVLVTGEGAVSTAYFHRWDNYPSFGLWSSGNSRRVTHWMPLLEPPSD